MSEIHDFAGTIPGFYRKSAVEQLIVLAWFIEARQQRAVFDGLYMKQCFKDVGLEPPDMSVYLPRLAGKKPPQLIKDKGGYRLSGALKRTLDTRFGGDPTVVAVTKALSDLPAKIPDLTEREFLAEALSCYRIRAFRAAVTMMWNLTYDHLVRWVLVDPARIQAFNAALLTKYPKKTLVVVKRDDIDELKESEFIEVARVAKLFDKNTTQILEEKLRRRNMGAHPS
ncbi:MAG: hypothetical protein ACT6RD_08505, partial [Brevundimonas sp.]